MGKSNPACRTREARREAILNVARELFLKEGYAATSMSHIAAKLGGSKGTLYNYFRSKEELFRAHVEERCLSHAKAMFAEALAGKMPVDILAEIAERVLSYILSDEAIAFYSVVVSEAQRYPEIGRAFFESGPLLGTHTVADYLELARSEGKVAVEDCARAAEQFVTLMQGSLYRRRVLNVIPMPTAAEIAAEARGAAEVFMRLYAPKQAG